MKRVAAIYTRVSTGDQTTANQLGELEAVAERNGWRVVEVYSDEAVSGALSRRPALDRLMKAVMQRKIDVVMAWSVDRLGRSLRHLVGLLEDLSAKGVDLYLHQQGLDTTTPSGRAMFGMCGVFAEFERAMLSERTRAGLARARAQGKRLGRPPIAGAVEVAIRRDLEGGRSLRATARRHGVGHSVVQRIRRELRAPAGS